jgi:hypothetical protein
MNRIVTTIIALTVPFLLSAFVFAQEKPVSGKPPLDVKEKAVKAQAAVRTRADFVGVVAHIDPSGRTIAVKNRGVIVTFDAAMPALKGYNNFEQIRKGDRVAISYTGGGTRISRGFGTDGAQSQESARLVPEAAGPQREATKTAKINRARPVRIRERTNSQEFRDVDNNGDGKITPVELGVVVPDLTVEKFKTFDRNADGSLNKPEYDAAKKSLTHGS